MKGGSKWDAGLPGVDEENPSSLIVGGKKIQCVFEGIRGL